MKHIIKLICLLLALALLSGCGLSGAPKTAGEDGQTVDMPNPMRESGEEEILERFGVDLAAPEGAKSVSYWIFEGAETPVAQMNYTLDGVACTCRVMKAAAYEDISGMYYEWQHSETADDSYGTTLRWRDDGAGVIDRFDSDSGRMESISLESGASEQTLWAAARQLWGETDGTLQSAEQSADTALTALLSELRESCFPGTAGSSLSAAAGAVKLADYFAASGITPDTVSAIVQDYASALTAEEAQLFDEQLGSVVGGFSALTAEGGEGLLADCGVEAEFYPWEQENVRNCFVALLGSD